jgi:cyclophilin family peptidyl-prolyl cis-trans isomerase
VTGIAAIILAAAMSPRSAPATFATALAAVALVAAGCGADNSGKTPGKGKPDKGAKTTASTSTPAKPTPPKPPPPPTCKRVNAPPRKGPQKLAAPKLPLDQKRIYTVSFTTNCGTFTITVDAKRAPKTAASFIALARKGFYDGLTFHRIIPGFVIQGGDPQGDGQGGPGYSVVEKPPGDLKYTRGIVAMAKTEIEDPGTSGSQFFVVTGPDAQLPPDYALVGRVTGGQDVVATIGSEATNQTATDPAARDRPLNPVVMQRVSVTETAPKTSKKK